MTDASPEAPLRGELISDSPDATRALARRLGALCRGGETLLLRGDLGSGKTCFVQGLAAGLEVPARLRVTSPTFTLHAEYPGRLVLNHLDLYRLESPAALEGLGIEDMLADRSAVTAVEWPELLEPRLGRERLDITIAAPDETRRSLALAAAGPRHAALLAAWLAG